VASKPFNTNYHIETPNGFILVNGDQITKTEAARNGENWDITLHLSDGSAHFISANRFTKLMAQGILDQIGEDEESPDE